MFLLTIAFRNSELSLENEVEMVKLGNMLIHKMKSEGVRFYEEIESCIYPMTQLEAGFHCNLDALGTKIDRLTAYFKVHETSEKILHFRTRKIAKNFWKLDYKCADPLPFRIASGSKQDLKVLKRPNQD